MDLRVGRHIRVQDVHRIDLPEGITIPLDVLKVRMQLQGEQGGKRAYANALQAVGQIYRSEGAAAFAKGLKPALLRQATYGTMRVGL